MTTEIERRHNFIAELVRELEIVEDNARRTKAVWQKYSPEFQARTGKAKKTL